MSEVESILAQRGSVYGPFSENGRVAQGIKDTFRTGSSWPTLANDAREALDQIALKISRIVTGDPEYLDNYDDIAGYASRVAMRIRGVQPKPPSTMQDLIDQLRGITENPTAPPELVLRSKELADMLAGMQGAPAPDDKPIPKFLREKRGPKTDQQEQS